MFKQLKQATKSISKIFVQQGYFLKIPVYSIKYGFLKNCVHLVKKRSLKKNSMCLSEKRFDFEKNRQGLIEE